MVTELLHFRTAVRYRLSLPINGLVCLAIGYILLGAALNNAIAGWHVSIVVPHAVGYLAASLFVAAAGFVSSSLMVYGRMLAVAAATGSTEILPRDSSATRVASRWWRTKRLGLRRERFQMTRNWLAAWPQVIVAMMLASAAMTAVITTWRLGDQLALSASLEQLLGILLILLAFPLLVLERVYANTDAKMLPEAPQLERLLRVPLVTFVGLGLTSMLGSFGFSWSTIIERVTGILIAIVSLELLIRGAAILFLPFAPIDTRRSVADSWIAGLLRLKAPDFNRVSKAMRRDLGIDLSRSWALAFIRRTALPIALGMLVLAWCITGVTALALNERAIYERLGVPVTVFGPGLHVHLPWPLGIVRHVELGVVHEISVVPSEVEGSLRIGSTDPLQPVTGAEDIPPPSADRLWDASHPSEASYLIASESQGKQSFQVANIDMRIVYRIGLSDSAATNAAYAVVEPEALIRIGAGELLVRYFARYALIDVLGQSRDRFTNDFRNELQEGLDGLSTGIDVIAVIVEAIHPPPGAARAYHNVQAAEINARSAISFRRAGAIQTLEAAQRAATDQQNMAIVAASESVNKARAVDTLFQGDRQAYDLNPRAFLLERWLNRLGSSLAKSQFVVIDSRLAGINAPTIDLRSFSGALGMTDTVNPIR